MPVKIESSMFSDISSTQEVQLIEKNGKYFNVEVKRGPKGFFSSALYHTQRLLSPEKRRLYRYYNLTPRRFWNEVSTNEWEPSTFRIFDKYLSKNHSYLDIGAWIGPTVLYGSQLAKHCYAIEPDPIAYKQLTSNIKLNPHLSSKVTALNRALGSHCGPVKLGRASFVGGDSKSSLLLQKNSWTVEAITLQKLMENIVDCNFIKMDIEGGEALVLPTMAEYLQHTKPTLFLSLHAQLFPNPDQDMKTILEILSSYKYLVDANGNPLSKDVLQKHATDSVIATDCD